MVALVLLIRDTQVEKLLAVRPVVVVVLARPAVSPLWIGLAGTVLLRLLPVHR
jgi:hypothetical protein